jgi:ComF family protein
VFALAVDLFAAILSPPRCAACDEPVSFRTAFCPSCAATLVPARVAHAAFEYGGAIERAIHRFKYRDRPDLARPLGSALARIAPKVPRVDGVMPVPLHPKRLADRGYNQSALIARPLAHVLGVPLRSDLLVRHRDTPHQAELSKAGRTANVTGAFSCPDRRGVQGKSWLIVDDVRTTGATLGACAHALRLMGAKHIHLAVLALVV